MSKAIHITYKKEIKDVDFKQIREKIYRINDNIMPDNISPNLVNIQRDQNTISAIFNPVDTVVQNNTSLCLGYVHNKDWDDINSDPLALEGTFALFRKDENMVQLITDWVASRTIWYYRDEEKMIAATSQLAIIYFLGDFDFNKKVIPWVLSSGTLGPFYSWDKRIRALKPKTTLSLDISNWQVNEEVEEIKFTSDATQKNPVKSLKNGLDKTFRHFKIDTKKWVLPLSGGYDSRGILLFLKKHGYKDLQTITWGTEESQNKKDNDAYIAKKMADQYGTSHQYLSTNETDDSVNTIVDRFLVNGEGRIDDIAGYMDGFKIWKDLFENKKQGVIRGDEAFGTGKYLDKPFKFNLCDDYTNLKPILKRHGWSQNLPDYYKNLGDTRKERRDLLYQVYSIPMGLAALNTLKLNYCEITNPLLSPSTLKIVYKLSDTSRDDKTTFRKIIDKIIPQIPIAKSAAITSQEDILRQEEFTSYILSELNKNTEPFEESFIDEFCESINSDSHGWQKTSFKRIIKDKVKKLFPASFIQYLMHKVQIKDKKLDHYILAFRILIIIKMKEMIDQNIKPQNH